MKKSNVMNNFINQNDPTSPIDLNSISLETQYSQLSEREKLLVGCKLLGMNHIPVPILDFIKDPYFCGHEGITNNGKAVFPFWLDKLQEIFPTPITTSYPYISFGGCVGSGKSFMSRMMGLYHLHRLDCCVNPHSSLGLAAGAKIAIAFMHPSFETAKRDFLTVYKEIFELSPYFRTTFNNVLKRVRLIASGPSSKGAVIGSQLVYTILSELGHWRPSDANAKLGEVLVRYNSRFANKRFNFGGVICDSSAKDAENSASTNFEEAVPERELFKISPSHWQVRPELYLESKGQTFDFYRGDQIRQPRVLEPDDDRTGLDLGRIIHPPIQTKFMFLNAPIRSLQDLAGFSYSGSEKFMDGNLDHLLKCSSMINNIPEVIDDIDFYDLNDTIYDRVQPMIDRIPKLMNIYIHIDCGLKKDLTGISICYFNGERVQGETSYPTFKIPCAFCLSRKKGQSTSLDHIFQFIQRLSQDFQVNVSADTFGSAGLFQQLERVAIPYKVISVDRSMDPYVFTKNIINTERIELPYLNRLLREFSELRIVNTGTSGSHMKIDHPEVSSSTEFDYKGLSGAQPGTKDLSDAVTGSIWACNQGYTEFAELGANGVNKQLEATRQLTYDPREEAAKKFQDMLQNIF